MRTAEEGRAALLEVQRSLERISRELAALQEAVRSGRRTVQAIGRVG